MRTKLLSALAAVVTLVCVSTAALGAGTIKIEGGLPRDLGAGEVRITVVIDGILPTDYQQKGASDADKFRDRMVVKIPALDSSPLPFTPEAATGNAKFYVDQWQTPFLEETNNDGNIRLTYYVSIKEATTGQLSEKFKDGSMGVKISFKLGGSEYTPETEATLKQEAYVVNEAPTYNEGDVPVIGSHHSLRVTWTAADTVAIKGATNDSSPKKPTNMNVYVIDRDAYATLDLPAKKFSGTAGTADSDASCKYTTLSSNRGACVVCADDVYLNDSQVAKLDETGDKIKVKTGRASDGGLTVAGLDNEKTYVVFLQYEPDSLKTSECFVGQPSPNFSLTELNGEGEAKVEDFRCFIATAAYGTPLHNDLKLFRHVRDGLLRKTALGRALVRGYYRYGPVAADFVAEHETLRAAVRAVLGELADGLRLVDAYY